MKKTKTSKKVDVLELLPMPSNLGRMTKSDLIEQVEFLIKISNLALEGKAQDKLFLLDKEIQIRTLEATILSLETYVEQLKEKNHKQASRHLVALEKASEEFVCFGRC